MSMFNDLAHQIATHVESAAKRKNVIRESKVEKHLHLKVTAAGGTTRKFKSIGRPHVPDRIVVWAGETNMARVHFVECKAFGKEPRDGQLREHRRLRKLGCIVLVLDTKEKVDDYVEKMR